MLFILKSDSTLLKINPDKAKIKNIKRMNSIDWTNFGIQISKGLNKMCENNLTVAQNIGLKGKQTKQIKKDTIPNYQSDIITKTNDTKIKNKPVGWTNHSRLRMVRLGKEHLIGTYLIKKPLD